jgi:type 1 fimbria pilin
MNSATFRRLLHACALLCLSIAGIGGAQAQQPLNCTGTNVTMTPQQWLYNREYAVGEALFGNRMPAFLTRVSCTGGTRGQLIELRARAAPGTNARSNPYGPGLLLDSPIAGIGIVVVTKPFEMQTPDAIVSSFNRNSLTEQRVDGLIVDAWPIRTGHVDLNTDYALHAMHLLTMDWRAPGVVDDWREVNTWTIQALSDANNANLKTESCSFTGNANVALQRTHQLGTVSGNAFSGVGSIAPGHHVSGSMVLHCRNFAGGTLSIESPHAHPTMQGVLLGAPGAGAASGVGIRVSHTDGTPWRFGETRPVAPTGTGGSRDDPFSYVVRYIQTGPVAGGTFDTHFTLTVDYQ